MMPFCLVIYNETQFFYEIRSHKKHISMVLLFMLPQWRTYIIESLWTNIACQNDDDKINTAFAPEHFKKENIYCCDCYKCTVHHLINASKQNIICVQKMKLEWMINWLSYAFISIHSHSVRKTLNQCCQS